MLPPDIEYMTPEERARFLRYSPGMLIAEEVDRMTTGTTIPLTQNDLTKINPILNQALQAATPVPGRSRRKTNPAGGSGRQSHRVVRARRTQALTHGPSIVRSQYGESPAYAGTAGEYVANKNPNKEVDVKRALEDGDYVAVHSHVRQNPQDRGGALVHIFRFENERIAELWDIGQDIPKDSPNEYGVFWIF